MKIGETKKIKPISKEEISSPYAGKIPELPKYEPKKEESKITEIDKKKIGLLTRLKEAVKTAFGKLKKDKEEESLKTEKDLGLSSISQTLKTPKQIAREERVEFESARGVVGKLEIDDFYKPKLMTMMTQERDYKFAIEAGVTDKEIEEFVKLRKDLGFEKEKPEIFSKVETLETKLETAEDQIFKKLDNAGIVFDKDDFNEFIGRVSEAFERKESGESNFDKIYQSVEKSANLQEQIVGLKENLKNVKTDKEKKKLEKEILKLETNLSKEKEALQSNIWKEDSQISKRKQNNQTKMSNLITKYEEAAEITKRLDEITKNFTEQINEVQRENDLLEEERKQIKVEKIKLGLELEPEIKTIEEGIQKLIPDTAQSKNDLKDNLEKLKDYINKNPDADVASISEYSKGFEWKNNEDADFFNLRVRTNFGKDLGIERTNKDKLDNISYLVNKKIEETDTDFSDRVTYMNEEQSKLNKRLAYLDNQISNIDRKIESNNEIIKETEKALKLINEDTRVVSDRDRLMTLERELGLEPKTMVETYNSYVKELGELNSKEKKTSVEKQRIKELQKRISEIDSELAKRKKEMEKEEKKLTSKEKKKEKLGEATEKREILETAVSKLGESRKKPEYSGLLKDLQAATKKEKKLSK